ncbi:MAG: PocR ligand-binding domain-containing protein [Clostridia bacterium]|nr:PocR ligand-binding domain-containing protein [Clostridia bacterium]
MNYIFNREKITELISDFYISTGIAVTLYDSSFDIVATSPIYSDCCACIRTKQVCVDNCNRSNLIHFKEATNSTSTIFYACHAGLMETITPIIYDGTVIAYMQTGQFRDEDHVYSSSKKLAEAAKVYGLSEKKLLKLYEKLPVISKTKLRAQLNIMDVIIKSFWENGLIYCNRSMLSVKIEQYIIEHISEKIYISQLCDKFFLSKNSLYRLFKDEFNTTANEFILQKKLNYAQELLKTQAHLDITKVSAACGFSDYNYFIRIFKKRLGITPLQFRKTVGTASEEQ